MARQDFVSVILLTTSTDLIIENETFFFYVVYMKDFET